MFHEADHFHAADLLFGSGVCTRCAEDTGMSNTLIYGSSDYDSINPIMNEHCEIKHLLFDSLVKLDKDGKPTPSLAESWTYDDATLTYTFKLRNDVKWHDGEKFTADDIKFTIEAIMNPDNGSENYPNYIEIKEIKVISDTEIAFILSEPNYAFLEYMTELNPTIPISKQIAEAILIHEPKLSKEEVYNRVIAMEIDYHQQPPMFQITDTHYAATWLLDPRAPKITPPIGGKAHD